MTALRASKTRRLAVSIAVRSQIFLRLRFHAILERRR